MSLLQKSIAVLLLTSVGISAADPAKQQRKAREAAAKKLVAEAAAQEKGGNTFAARQLYLQAETQMFTKDAEKALERLDTQDREHVRSLLGSAERAWRKNDWSSAEASLRQAQQLQPGNATVLYDLALVLRQKERFADAEEILSKAAAQSSNEQTRLRLVSLLSAWRESSPAPTLSKVVLQTTTAESSFEQVNKNILIERGRWLSSGDREENRTENTCSVISGLPPSALPDSAPLRINRGFCAALAGRFDEGARLLESAQLPSDEADEQRRSFALLMKALADLPGQEGKSVRQLHAQALGQASRQQFQAAISSYAKAATALPSFSESNHQLALLAEALGDGQAAATAWTALLNAPEESLRAEARAALDSKQERETQYVAAIAAARRPLEILLRRHLIEGELAHKHYALNQMEQCAKSLYEAAAIHPLAPEAQTLGALLAMQRNDFSQAEWHGRSLAAAGATLSFYGAIYPHSPGDEKQKKNRRVQFSRVDMVRDGISITELSTYEPRKHKALSEKIRKLETKDEYLHLELIGDRNKTRKLWIEPLHLALEVPPQGPGARRFANQYTHLVAYTIGYDTAKLGKESLTFAERARLAYEFASLGWETYAAVMNPMGAYDAYRQFRRVTKLVSQDTRSVGRRGDTGEATPFGLPFQFLPGPPAADFVLRLK